MSKMTINATQLHQLTDVALNEIEEQVKASIVMATKAFAADLEEISQERVRRRPPADECNGVAHASASEHRTRGA